MKQVGTALLVASLSLLPGAPLFAQDSSRAPAPAAAESGSWAKLKKDIVILVRARIPDSTIIAYIRQNVVPGEQASSQDVIDLKQAGASDAVLTAVVQATHAANTPGAPSVPSVGSSGTTTPDTFGTYVVPYPGDGDYDYSYGADWPYSYYYSYPYGYGYPYWGFGFSSPFFFRDHDGRFHRGDRFVHGHFGDGDRFRGGHFSSPIAPHTFQGHGIPRGGGGVPHGGASHGGGGHGGGGGHR